jgi:hypothetical protein
MPERNYEECEYARDCKTPPPPYSTHWNYEKTAQLEKKPPNTKLQNFWSALKEHFLNPKKIGEKEEDMLDSEARDLYEVVRQNPEAFDLEPNVYSEPCTNVTEIRQKFHRYPPHCRIACCTHYLLQAYDSAFANEVNKGSDRYCKVEWLYDCERVPEPISKNCVVPGYWDEEAQGDVRFPKAYEGAFAPCRGWVSASVWHVGYIEGCESPRSDVFFLIFILAVPLIMTIWAIHAARFRSELW